MTEAVSSDYLGHRHPKHFKWEECTVLTSGTKNYLSETYLKLTILLFFFKKSTQKNSWPELFSSIRTGLAVFAHFSLISMHETNQDEVDNNHRPKGRWNYVMKFIAIPEERRASKETI